MKKILVFVLVLLLALQALPFAALAEELPHEHEEEEYVTAEMTEEEPADDELPPEEVPAAEPAPEEETDETAPITAEPQTPVLPDEELTAEGSAAEIEAVPVEAEPMAVTAPTSLWIEPSESNGLPSRITVYKKSTSYLICLPGNAVVSECFLSWDGGTTARVGGTSYDSGSCPIPSGSAGTTYEFRNGSSRLASLSLATYKGSAGVHTMFIEIDESLGTIADMKRDKENSCSGIVFIDGQEHVLSKMKGRGNATWTSSDDKKPYNITLGKKINFPGIDSEKTKKWSLLAEALDRSLLCNRTGFHLAEQMGIGQDTASVDVWMNGEYQGCYTVTPKTDSFVPKNGWMIEQDNYKEDPVAQGGDPQFQLTGLKEDSGWSSCYNRITVKKMGDDFLGYDEAGEVDESAANMEAKAAEIQSWLQDAWDAMRSDTGYNSKGKYYTDYIDIESFAQMYLIHEYVKNYDVCAGSILFHRDGQTDADKLIAGPLWDLDNALGSTYQNSKLGKADDRTNGDRRSAQGHFIENITEYKTSIYKTLRKHADFMEEVTFQYNRYKDAFDALPDDAQALFDEISASAAMNHAKVNDLGNSSGKNLHYYRSATTLGNGSYRQSYAATTQWSNYTANLKTYITVRSLWFRNNYTDEDFWNDPTYEWSEDNTSVTATRASRHSASYTETETVSTAAEITVPAACETMGTTKYTATFANPAFAAQTKTVQDIPPLGHDWGDPSYEWTEDNSHVTATRICRRDASHIETETVETSSDVTTQATCEGMGKTTYTAVFENTGFGTQTKTVEDVPATGHTPGEAVRENEKATTCTEDGSYDLAVYCTVCHKELSRETKMVPALGHDWDDPTYEWSADNTSVTATRVCKRDASHTETETVETASEVTAPSTCEGKGTTKYTAAFENPAFATQTKEVQDIEALGHTPGEAVRENEKAPTCTEDGSYDMAVYCTVCHKELSRETNAVPALGHDWADPVYEWAEDNGSVTATRVCRRDASHKETETAGTAAEITKQPTCEEKGETTYTASFENAAFEKQTKTVKDVPASGHTPADPVRENEKAATCTEDGSYEEAVYCSVCGKELSRETKTIPALGHDWADPMYEWAEDNGSVTATRACKRDASHKETETADTSAEITKQPACEEKGETTWTAVFENAAFAKQTKTEANIEPTGHTPAEPVKEKEKPATCTEDGSWDDVVYCSVCHMELSRETKTIPATGHDWGEPAYEWAEDNGTATASRTCGNDPSHVDSETVKTTSEVTKEPTCEEPGETTWTAAFANKAFTGQTKTEANIPSLGHEPGEPVTENEVPATEEADGSHDVVVYCTRCGKELSRETVADKFVWPEFKTQSLVLSGQIGLNFYMDLSGLTEEQRSASRVEFKVGKADPVSVLFDAGKVNGKGYFGFTCYINSIQMADTIKAVYHYGDEKTVSKEYSVLRYLQAVDRNASFYDDKTVALAHAIADYGHYAQIYLSSINHWTIGTDYAAMTLHYAESFDYADILSKVQANAFVKAIDGTNVTKATYKLHLDSETTVDVFLTTKDGKTPSNVKLYTTPAGGGSVTVKNVTPAKQSDGRYLIRISGISAHRLGDLYEINGTAGKTFTVQVSALSYVRSVLNNAGSTAAAKDGLSALYKYYEAVMAYRT